VIQIMSGKKTNPPGYHDWYVERDGWILRAEKTLESFRLGEADREVRPTKRRGRSDSHNTPDTPEK